MFKIMHAFLQLCICYRLVKRSQYVQKGLISLRWDWDLAQEGIESLQSLLKNSARFLKKKEKDDSKTVAQTLSVTKVTWAHFCTQMVYQTHTQVKHCHVRTVGRFLHKGVCKKPWTL